METVVKAKPVKSYGLHDGKMSSSAVKDLYRCPCGSSCCKIEDSGKSYIYCPECSKKYSDKFILVDGYLIFEEK